MTRVLHLLLSRWALSLLGTVLLAALVWVFGPLLPVLEAVLPRLLVVLVMLLIWVCGNASIESRRRQREQALARGVTEPDPTAIASAEEVAALRERLTASLALLRRASGRRGYLYEQPWYVIIGPPGAGKTTALLNAGLHFPLAGEAGAAVPGVGGTRLCDWWFAEQAVLIDTAGRYTTQDSDAAVDRAGWQAFLDLLKRTRARQPLNGVIVAIALTDIAGTGREERMAHARAIRRRVKEITERLGARVPVYAMLTKADLIAGFTEYFDDLDRERRDQVWGMTFPLETDPAGPVVRFGPEFSALVGRLQGRLVERLQAERSPDRRALIAGFPAQVASLADPVSEFLELAFGGSRLDPAPLLRGVYLTSGAQEGTPIDRLTGVLARSFGLDQRHAAVLRPEHGRSYFLGRLLRDAIFGEALLVARDPRAARRRLLLRGGAYAATALATIAIGVGLLTARAKSEAAIARSSGAVAAYRRLAATLPLNPVADDDLLRIVPLLNAARALPYGAGATVHRTGFSLPGLSRDAELAAGAHLTYRHALDYALLPRLIRRLEAEMRTHLDQPEFLYEATRVYLMLGGEGPLDPALIKQWLALDWQRIWPGAGSAPLRAALGQHLAALLSGPLPPVKLDGALVQAARATFSRVTPAERAYSRIRLSAAAAALPAWTPAAALGPAGEKLFVRASGQALTDGIPGFFTLHGFRTVLLPALPEAAHDVASESWVLGRQDKVASDPAALQALEQGVVTVYLHDYQQHWDALLGDVQPAPLHGLRQAADELYILASPQSPLRNLLTAAVQQLDLSAAPSAPLATAALAKKVALVAATPLARLLAPGMSGVDTALATFNDHYKPLRDFVGHGPGAPIDGVLALMNTLQQQLGLLAAGPTSNTPPPMPSGNDPVRLLLAEGGQVPAPVGRWLRTMAAGANDLRGGGARALAAAAFSGNGGPGLLCRQAVAGHFPFSPGSDHDIPLGDFARLFAPGGLLDNFFNTELRGYVDTSARVWRAEAVNGVAPPVSPHDLARFQRAATIRDMFFPAGASTPSLRFEITPVGLDASSKQATLTLGGVRIVVTHGTHMATEVAWPGADGTVEAGVSFDPSPQNTGALHATGPWALFHLLALASVHREGADRTLVTFRSAGHWASFEFRAGSVLNPFAPGALTGFACPAMP